MYDPHSAEGETGLAHTQGPVLTREHRGTGIQTLLSSPVYTQGLWACAVESGAKHLLREEGVEPDASQKPLGLWNQKLRWLRQLRASPPSVCPMPGPALSAEDRDESNR